MTRVEVSSRDHLQHDYLLRPCPAVHIAVRCARNTLVARLLDYGD